jgi:hypothetical protein
LFKKLKAWLVIHNKRQHLFCQLQVVCNSLFEIVNRNLPVLNHPLLSENGMPEVEQLISHVFDRLQLLSYHFQNQQELISCFQSLLIDLENISYLVITFPEIAS